MNAHTHPSRLSREHGCLHGQWRAFVMVVADALTRLTGDDWAPADFDDLHVAQNYAAWSIVRADGFALKLASHHMIGVASMVWPADWTLLADTPAHDRNEPVCMFKRHANPDRLAERLVDEVIGPMEGIHARLVSARATQNTLDSSLERNSATLGAMLAQPAADPSERTGRSHLVDCAGVFGRVRLGRAGEGTVEVSGLSHGAILRIAEIIAGEAAPTIEHRPG